MDAEFRKIIRDGLIRNFHHTDREIARAWEWLMKDLRNFLVAQVMVNGDRKHLLTLPDDGLDILQNFARIGYFAVVNSRVEASSPDGVLDELDARFGPPKEPSSEQST